MMFGFATRWRSHWRGIRTIPLQLNNQTEELKKSILEIRERVISSDSKVNEILSRFGRETALRVELDALQRAHEQVLHQAWLSTEVQSYNRAIAAAVDRSVPFPLYYLHGTWQQGTPFDADLLILKLREVGEVYEENLIAELHEKNIEGAIVEFGLFDGRMLSKLLAKGENLGMERRFYGFDSFEGLSEPSAEYDHEYWEKGKYAATYETAARNLRLSERPHLSLIKGWVEDSLKTKEAQAINPIAYARIDVDLYGPTVDCLNYLSERLTDGAVLMFDDWSYVTGKGQGKAFFDWVPKVPQYRFEFLAQCSTRFYLRVHHRKG